MPICADFGVINQYLSIKDQVDSGIFCPDQADVPELMDKHKDVDGFDYSFWQPHDTKKSDFLDFPEEGSWFLQPVDKIHELQGPMTTPALTPTTTSNPSIAPESTTVSVTETGPATKTYVTASMSGATVIQRSTYSQDFFPENTSGDVCSPEILDLDKQSFYDDSDACRVKQEQMEDGYCEVRPSGVSSQNPRLCSLTEDCGLTSVMQTYMNDIRADMRYTTGTLGISLDPSKWSHRDSQRWVQHICEQNKFDNISTPLYNVEGSVLSRMSLEDFRCRSGDKVGELLYQTLDILKMVNQITPETPVAEQTSFFSQMQQNVSLGSGRIMQQQLPQCLGDFDATSFTTSSPAPSPDSLSSHSHSSSSDSYGPAFTLEEDVFPASLGVGQRQHTPSPHSPASTTTKNSSNNHGPSPHRPVRGGKQTIHLWQFLRELLDDPDNYQCCIKWLDRSKGIFKIEDSSKVAKYWGRRKNRPAMNYDKLSRSVRQYYKKGIIKKTTMSKRLVYQFCQPYL